MEEGGGGRVGGEAVEGGGVRPGGRLAEREGVRPGRGMGDGATEEEWDGGDSEGDFGELCDKTDRLFAVRETTLRRKGEGVRE